DRVAGQPLSQLGLHLAYPVQPRPLGQRRDPCSSQRIATREPVAVAGTALATTAILALVSHAVAARIVAVVTTAGGVVLVVVGAGAAEQGLRGDEDAQVRSHPADGGQTAAGDRAA